MTLLHVLSVINDLSHITNDNILMPLGNAKLTIVGLKNIIDSTTTYYPRLSNILKKYFNKNHRPSDIFPVQTH